MSIRVTGVAEIRKCLAGMPKELNDRFMQTVHTQAVKPTIERMKLTAPEGPNGDLVDSIGVVKATRSSLANRDLGAINAGARRGGRYKGYHAHLVEYGTKPRKNKRGANRGVMPKKPFAYPAWMATKDKVLGSINEITGKKLVNYMRRTLPK